MFKHISLPHLFFVVTTVLLTSQCKTSEDSDTKTLDNFARSGATAWQQNSCGVGTSEVSTADEAFIAAVVGDRSTDQGNQEKLVEILVADPNRKELDRAAIKQALRSVPTILSGAFFSFGGRIVVRPDTKALCSTAEANLQNSLEYKFESEGNREVNACVREHLENVNVNGEEVQVTSMYLYLSDDPAKISHALVRGIGVVLAERLSRVDMNKEGNAIQFGTKIDEGFEQAVEELTKALLVDTIANKSYDLSLYNNYLGTVLGTQTEESRIKAWREFAQKNPSVANHFRNNVFAESFDSYFCSADSRSSMDKNFNRTFKVFVELTTAVDQLKANLTQVDSAEQLAANSNATPQGGSAQLTSDESPAPAGKMKSAPKPSGSDVGFVASAGAALWGGRILGGLGRAVVGVARGAGRVAVGVGRAAGRMVGGIARVTSRVVVGVGRVAVGVVRTAANVVRTAGRVVVGALRATGRVIGTVVNGAAMLVRGAVGVAGRAVGWAIMATGQVVRGMFGAFGYIAGCIGTRCSRAMGLAADDADNDKISDGQDQCFNSGETAGGVHKTGFYMGCARGQYTDGTLAKLLAQNGYDGNADQDGDGVPNDDDFCSATPVGDRVNLSSDWRGCSYKQTRDADVLERVAASSGY